jgi:hypothetical protein
LAFALFFGTNFFWASKTMFGMLCQPSKNLFVRSSRYKRRLSLKGLKKNKIQTLFLVRDYKIFFLFSGFFKMSVKRRILYPVNWKYFAIAYSVLAFSLSRFNVISSFYFVFPLPMYHFQLSLFPLAQNI